MSESDDKFAIVPQSLLASSRYNNCQKVILSYCLGTYQTKLGNGEPWTFSIGSIIHGTGNDDRTIQRNIKPLIKDGILKRLGTRRNEKRDYNIFLFDREALDAILTPVKMTRVNELTNVKMTPVKCNHNKGLNHIDDSTPVKMTPVNDFTRVIYSRQNDAIEVRYIKGMKEDSIKVNKEGLVNLSSSFSSCQSIQPAAGDSIPAIQTDQTDKVPVFDSVSTIQMSPGRVCNTNAHSAKPALLRHAKVANQGFGKMPSMFVPLADTTIKNMKCSRYTDSSKEFMEQEYKKILSNIPWDVFSEQSEAYNKQAVVAEMEKIKRTHGVNI